MASLSSDWPSVNLLSLPQYKAAGNNPGTRENALRLANNAYLRAEALWKAYGITVEDIVGLSDKFFDIHMDPAMWWDGSSMTVMTIHLNLAVGTIGMYSKDRPDLQALLKDMMEGKAFGQYTLTEVGHGLDVQNLETTTTLLEDGTFEIHSPTPYASKYMPPTVPVLGKPCYGIIWSNLVVAGENRGHRAVLVQLNDGVNMCKGITSKLLPTRHGATPVNHAITHFNHVKLPSTALLGPVGDKPATHDDFLQAIWRIACGTLALSSAAIPALKIASHIAYKYSVRREVGIPKVPIISFRTQQIPIFTAVAQAYVLQATQKYIAKYFVDPSVSHQVRHAMATIFKATAMEQAQTSHFNLAERCGAQGMFDYNQIITQYSEMRGIVIAEGDILVLCIRLASELLLGRYAVPQTTDASSFIAKHEAGVFSEGAALAKKFGHRSQVFADLILPRSKEIVEAVGHRMAYDAATNAGVPKPLVDLYHCNVINRDIGWYIESGLLTRSSFAEMLNSAIKAAEPHMNEYVDAMNVGPWVKAPILAEESWNKFVDNLYTFREAPEVTASM